MSHCHCPVVLKCYRNWRVKALLPLLSENGKMNYHLLKRMPRGNLKRVSIHFHRAFIRQLGVVGCADQIQAAKNERALPTVILPSGLRYLINEYGSGVNSRNSTREC